MGEVTVPRIEAGASVTPPTARKIAGALGVSIADLMESPPVPAGKAEAPEAGPVDEDHAGQPTLNDALEAQRREERRRSALEEIRESYRDSREGLDRYCDRWEKRIADDDLDRRSVQEFLLTAADWLPILRDSYISECLELASVLGVGEGSGLTDEIRAESGMYPAVDRYHDIGRQLQKAWQDRFAPAEPPVIDFEAAREELLARRTG